MCVPCCTSIRDVVFMYCILDIEQVWDMRTFKRLFDLPGHADEVYAVYWAPDGDRVASGSKDRTIKIWSK